MPAPPPMDLTVMPMTTPEPPLSAQDYAFLSRLVYDRTRICLGPDKQPLVVSRLGRHLKSLGCGSFAEYCGLLSTPAGADEIDGLIDLITTNHTQFFRERAHFEFLGRELLPLLATRAEAAGRGLRLWSAASASGEEAYSLAIVLAECSRSRPLPAWRVYASDISRRMLDRCRLGIYAAERVDLPSAELLPRYFRRGFGPRQGFYRVKPELRGAVAVEPINLFQDTYPVPAELDVIFCRNVMIYFDTASRVQLVQRLFEQLAPGGHLFIGHTESLIGLRHRFRQVRPSVYVRPA